MVNPLIACTAPTTRNGIDDSKASSCALKYPITLAPSASNPSSPDPVAHQSAHPIPHAASKSSPRQSPPPDHPSAQRASHSASSTEDSATPYSVHRAAPD